MDDSNRVLFHKENSIRIEDGNKKTNSEPL